MISIQISGDVEKSLATLCKESRHTPQYHIQKAIQHYLEDLEDVRRVDKAYKEFLESGEKGIPLEDIVTKLRLDEDGCFSLVYSLYARGSKGF